MVHIMLLPYCCLFVRSCFGLEILTLTLGQSLTSSPKTMPPKKSASDYMREVRDYIAQHGSAPVETPNSAGCRLAARIRVARAKGVFSAAELAELDSGIPAPAAVQKKPAGAIAAAATVAQPKSALAKTTPGKRGASPSQERSASAAAPMTSKRSKMPEVNLREGLFVDPQQGALSGMASSTTTPEICADYDRDFWGDMPPDPELVEACRLAGVVCGPLEDDQSELTSHALSLVTLNVDGLGDYAESPADRMEAILTEVLLVEPDVLALQEVTCPHPWPGRGEPSQHLLLRGVYPLPPGQQHCCCCCAGGGDPPLAQASAAAAVGRGVSPWLCLL